MNRSIYTIFIVILLLGSANSTNGQGCVAIRGGSCGQGIGTGFTLNKGDISLSTNFRYFRSFRHFRGDEEETHRADEGTEVVNYSSFLDLIVSYGLSDKFYATAVIPFVHHKRSSMYEHGGNPPKGLGERHITRSSGLSDIRLALGRWLLDPKKHHRLNLALEAGIKLPTGNYRYKDVFYNQGTAKDMDEEKVVDQSIQLGDGGVGVSLGTQFFAAIQERGLALVNLFYLSNPQTTNGVLTRSGRSEFSCPDQYAARAGLYYSVINESLMVYGGGRWEGVPASDLIGSSEGYRRPGYAVSAEPGITFIRHGFQAELSVPVSLYRNRVQSFEDKVRTAETGVYRHGDAAFADYLININISWLLPSRKHAQMDGGHEM